MIVGSDHGNDNVVHQYSHQDAYDGTDKNLKRSMSYEFLESVFRGDIFSHFFEDFDHFVKDFSLLTGLTTNAESIIHYDYRKCGSNCKFNASRTAA